MAVRSVGGSGKVVLGVDELFYWLEACLQENALGGEVCFEGSGRDGRNVPVPECVIDKGAGAFGGVTMGPILALQTVS